MNDFKSLIIGVFGGLIVLVISKLFREYRKRSVRDDIEFLEYEKNHLQQMKKSSVEMNRSSFRALFAVLMFIALANLVPRVLDIFGINDLIIDFLGLLLWGFVFGFSIKFWHRYDNLKNYKEATAKIEDKLESLKSKYNNS